MSEIMKYCTLKISEHKYALIHNTGIKVNEIPSFEIYEIFSNRGYYPSMVVQKAAELLNAENSMSYDECLTQAKSYGRRGI